MTSGVRKRLDDEPPEEPFEVAVGVEPEHLEQRRLRLLRETPEQLAKSSKAGGSSLSAGNVTWST